MSSNNNFACNIGTVILSIIIGVIIGVLFAFGYIPGVVTAVWIAFGLGVLGLVILAIAIFVGVSTRYKALIKCLQLNINCLLVGIWGTIITGLAALSIVLTPGSVLIAILIGIGAFFLSLLIISLILFTLCVVYELSPSITPFSDK